MLTCLVRIATKYGPTLCILIYSSISYGNTILNYGLDIGNKNIFYAPLAMQDISISGTILDSNNQPLPGASIVEKGTSNGTQSDFDGNFELQVSEQNAVLVISYIGFATQEVSLSGQTSITITLQEDAANLDEVVVIGYGTQKKSDLTGAVGSVKAEELAERPAASMNQAMAGKVAGVNVTSGSGRPGGRTVVRIRGNTSVSIANTPLYV
ncbi:MAG: TonB-dependent receptor plug domain-containing protein, partial [Pricia sp.]|nr:TonB-dependent receptor plug domain-containing protein [Pricia sp.]